MSFQKSLWTDLEFKHCISRPAINVDSLLLFKINILFVLHMFCFPFTKQ